MPRGPAALGLLLAAAAPAARAQDSLAFQRIEVASSIDRSLQLSNLYVPPGIDAPHPAPLVVLLHTWSFTLDQRHPGVEREVARRGWLLLVPNFRGRNDRPEACGSPTAQQDILDAVAWVSSHYPVDRSRVYVLGMSGGGHMTMLVTARALAAAPGSAAVSEAEIAELSQAGTGLSHPTPSDTASDSLITRRIYLRRRAGPSRLTIFDGKHEWFPSAAIAWLAEHRKSHP